MRDIQIATGKLPASKIPRTSLLAIPGPPYGIVWAKENSSKEQPTAKIGTTKTASTWPSTAIAGGSVGAFLAAREVPQVFKNVTLKRGFNLGLAVDFPYAVQTDFVGLLGSLNTDKNIYGEYIFDIFKTRKQLETGIRDLCAAQTAALIGDYPFYEQSVLHETKIRTAEDRLKTAFTSKPLYST